MLASRNDPRIPARASSRHLAERSKAERYKGGPCTNRSGLMKKSTWQRSNRNQSLKPHNPGMGPATSLFTSWGSSC